MGTPSFSPTSRRDVNSIFDHIARDNPQAALDVMRKIEEKTKIESRHVVLGHTQRGGTPVASDRVLATQFGHHAMELLKGNTQGRMVAMQGLKLTDIPMLECAGKQRLVPLDHHLVAAARSVHTSFGD